MLLHNMTSGDHDEVVSLLPSGGVEWAAPQIQSLVAGLPCPILGAQHQARSEVQSLGDGDCNS